MSNERCHIIVLDQLEIILILGETKEMSAVSILGVQPRPGGDLKNGVFLDRTLPSLFFSLSEIYDL